MRLGVLYIQYPHWDVLDLSGADPVRTSDERIQAERAAALVLDLMKIESEGVIDRPALLT